MSVETSRYLHILKSEEWSQDQGFILDVELRNNKKKGDREVALLGQVIRPEVGHLAMGMESCKKCLLSSYWIVELEAVPNSVKTEKQQPSRDRNS